MRSEQGKGIDLGAISVVLGVVLVIASVVWVTVINFMDDDEKSGDGITWVG